MTSLGTSRTEQCGGISLTERILPGHMRIPFQRIKWSFVFDPAGRLCYYWSIIVSLAFLYNFWVIIYRFAFQEINRELTLYTYSVLSWIPSWSVKIKT